MSLPDLSMTSPLILSIDPDDPEVVRVGGGTYMHKDRIASIPGSRFVGKGKDYWTVPRSWAALKVLTRLFPNGLVWMDGTTEWANEVWTTLVEPSLALRNQGAKPEWVEAVAGMLPEGIDSKDYQVAGALYLATAKRAMLFDEQGTGKMTQTALTLMLYPDTGTTLIMCPKSVVFTWQRELAKFGLKSQPIDGAAAERRKQFDSFAADDECRILIISYGLLAKHSRVSGYGTIKLTEDHQTDKELQQTKWVTVVADEAHRLKDPTAVQTRAAWACRNKATNVWALTGTPIEKNVVDFWALLHFIAPREFPSKTKFIDLWVMAVPNYFGGIDIIGLRPDTEQEFRDITEWHWRRVLSGDDLPDRVYDVRYARLEGKYAKAYKDMKKQLMAELDSDGSFETLFAPNHMVKSARLLQMAASQIVIDEHDKVRMTEPSWKLDTVVDTMKDYEGKAIIMWFKNRDLLHMMEARLTKAETPFLSLHGDVTGKDRDLTVQAFQEGKADVILCTYGAVAEGVTLTRAGVSFRVQRPYSSIQDEQAPFRNWRIGSEKFHDQVVYVDFVTLDTEEEDLIGALGRKFDSKQEILGDQR
jgi:SNF2 family DNA or RNA helicase